MRKNVYESIMEIVTNNYCEKTVTKHGIKYSIPYTVRNPMWRPYTISLVSIYSTDTKITLYVDGEPFASSKHLSYPRKQYRHIELLSYDKDHKQYRHYEQLLAIKEAMEDATGEKRVIFRKFQWDGSFTGKSARGATPNQAEVLRRSLLYSTHDSIKKYRLCRSLGNSR